MTATVFDDGLLHFQVKAADGQLRDHAIDILALKLACDECVEANRLPEDDKGRLKPTSAFMRDLANKIGELGVEGCTQSVAYALWIAATEGIETLKKNMSETPTSDSGSSETPAG